jgi:hypothetical protein
MMTSATRIEPPAMLVDAANAWLEPVRRALGDEFLSAYVTGSALAHGFDPKHSQVNVLVVANSLGPDVLDRVAAAIPTTKKPPHFDALFMTRTQMLASLDVFPIEWLDLRGRHFVLAGEDVFAGVDVPLTWLRLQCEHELRGKHLQLRQAYLMAHGRPDDLGRLLETRASGFATLFRTLLRLRGETPPADPAQVIERVSSAYGLDARAMLGPHVLRTSERRPKGDEVRVLFRKFLVEMDRLVNAIDELRLT